jgi:hypothetical protein
MSKQELLELVAPLSMEERRELRQILDETPPDFDTDTAFATMQITNPLKGSVGRYDDPFGPACDPNDWEVLRDSD